MRLIDVDALKKDWSMANKCEECPQDARKCQYEQDFSRMDICEMLDEAPTVGGWISVKDDMPKEHPSIFAPYYGTEKWNSAMWRNESDRVLVAIRFPDGTRTVDKGRLQDGVWKTGVSPVLPQEVTHWAMWPEPPKEEE